MNYALQRLYAEQKVDGGWGWFVQDRSNPIVTAYALIGLVEAQKAGFTVEQDVIDRAADFVRSSLLTIRAAERNLAAQPAGVPALCAGARRITAIWARTVRLFDERENMSTYAQAYLAHDLPHARSQRRARDGADQRSEQHLIVSATGAHWEETYDDYWNWNTDTRTTALGLMAMVQIDPTNQLIPNVVRWLMVARNADSWETTQETAWASWR